MLAEISCYLRKKYNVYIKLQKQADYYIKQ